MVLWISLDGFFFALIAIIGLKLFLHRLEKQEKQIDLQRKIKMETKGYTAKILLRKKVFHKLTLNTPI